MMAVFALFRQSVSSHGKLKPRDFAAGCKQRAKYDLYFSRDEIQPEYMYDILYGTFFNLISEASTR